MVSHEQQRRAYLEAMGIDVWLPRDAGEAVDCLLYTSDAADDYFWV